MAEVAQLVVTWAGSVAPPLGEAGPAQPLSYLSAEAKRARRDDIDIDARSLLRGIRPVPGGSVPEACVTRIARA